MTTLKEIVTALENKGLAYIFEEIKERDYESENFYAMKGTGTYQIGFELNPYVYYWYSVENFEELGDEASCYFSQRYSCKTGKVVKGFKTGFNALFTIGVYN